MVWDRPQPQVILTSPLSRALATAVALSHSVEGTVVVQAEPLLTEWCENSCDIGRAGEELHRDFPAVKGLLELDATRWCPLTLDQIRSGSRETCASVDQRCNLMLNTLEAMVPAATSVALVSHCMLLQRFQRQLQLWNGEATNGLAEAPFLANAEVRTLTLLPQST